MKFELKSKFKPTGDQPGAIAELVENYKSEVKDQILLGVTGSGKTFTIANVIQEVQKPTLVIAHNKTLAAQLADEFRAFFPDNAVHYFVSYYDYYQPEAYIPKSDTYIEKDSSINDEIDRLRHAATQALLTRSDVIIVASVSCIYGIGSPEIYKSKNLVLETGKKYSRKQILENLNSLHYERNDYNLSRGKYRVKGETIEVFPAYTDYTYRIIFFGDTVEKIEAIDSISGLAKEKMTVFELFPARHFITKEDDTENILSQIEEDMRKQVNVFKLNDQLIEAQRIEERTKYDLEMIRETGYCSGIENYSRYFDGRKAGSAPSTLIDFFPKDFLLVIDESHMTIPQIAGMYAGDRARKETLINYGFRLPAAADNRPLKFDEFFAKTDQIIYMSATPGDFEIERIKKNNGALVEQLIRPTGIIDPEIEVRPTKNQVKDLLIEIEKRTKLKQRVIVTTLTKRMAEDLTEYLQEKNIKVTYLHSDVATLERSEILRSLREGKYDVVIGINLLREGIDLPEVSLIAILDADKEGFLRGKTALVQTIGRAARNIEGRVIMYADRITDAMKYAISETDRRRKIQLEYNKLHNIKPKKLDKEIIAKAEISEDEIEGIIAMPKDEIVKRILELKTELNEVISKMQFERAAEIRDEIIVLETNIE